MSATAKQGVQPELDSHHPVDARDQVIVDLHADLAAEALDSVSFQATATVRFLARGDYAEAVRSYRRLVTLHKEFIAPSMKVVAASLGEEQRHDLPGGGA